MTISNNSSVHCEIADGPGVKGLVDSLCPIPFGKKKGQRRTVTFTLSSFGPEVTEGTVIIQVTIRFLENREGGWTFGGLAEVLSGSGKVYDAAVLYFDEDRNRPAGLDKLLLPRQQAQHVSGYFNPLTGRKGFARVGVQPMDHIEK